MGAYKSLKSVINKNRFMIFLTALVVVMSARRLLINYKSDSWSTQYGYYSVNGSVESDTVRNELLLEFWTPSIETQYDAAGIPVSRNLLDNTLEFENGKSQATAEQLKLLENVKPYYKLEDEEKLNRFADVLTKELKAGGYSRWLSTGKGKGTIKRGYLWHIAAPYDEDIVKKTIDVYAEFWDRDEGIYLRIYQ